MEPGSDGRCATLEPAPTPYAPERGWGVQTEAAVLWHTGGAWEIEPIELDPPRAGEVLVRMAAIGLCHSDEHVRTGDLRAQLPQICGHEGAGIVEEVGPGVTRMVPGDHVVFSFVPACGVCPSCAQGHSNLCDLGAVLLAGTQLDGTSRHHARGEDLFTMCCLGTFARHTVVQQASLVVIDRSIDLTRACLVGCGVTTGYGSSVYAAGVGPGDNVAVIGCGGIGSAAIQGARLAGAERIIAVDPVPWKLDKAREFGATHVAGSLEEARSVIEEATWGRMCDQAVCAMGVGQGDLMAAILRLVAKRGRVVVTNIHPMSESTITVNMAQLTLFEKQIVGSLFGSANPHYDIPKLLELEREGQIDLAGMVTATYDFEDLDVGYQDLRAGKNIRGVVTLG